jgi:hypothetical protein
VKESKSDVVANIVILFLLLLLGWLFINFHGIVILEDNKSKYAETIYYLNNKSKMFMMSATHTFSSTGWHQTGVQLINNIGSGSLCHREEGIKLHPNSLIDSQWFSHLGELRKSHTELKLGRWIVAVSHKMTEKLPYTNSAGLSHTVPGWTQEIALTFQLGRS